MTAHIAVDGAMGNVFIVRHLAWGTFGRTEVAPANSRKRRTRAANANDLTPSDKLILHGMASLAEADSAGVLVFDRPLDWLFGAIGIGSSWGYESINRLCKRGLIRRFFRSTSTLFELPMPPEPPMGNRWGKPVLSAPGQGELFCPVSGAPDTQSGPPVGAPGGPDAESRELSPARADPPDTQSGPPDTQSGPPDTQSGPPVGARAAPDSHDVLKHDEHHDVGSDREECKTLLRGIVIDGKRLDAGGINKLLTSPNCNAENIRNAVTITNFQLGQARKKQRPFNPMRYLYRLVFDGCTPPMTAEQRQQERKPEHVQESESADLHERRAWQSRERAINETLRELTDDQVNGVMQELIAAAQPGPHRESLARMARENPRLSASLRNEIHRRFCAGGQSKMGNNTL